MYSNILWIFYAAGFAMLAFLPRGRWLLAGLVVMTLILGKGWYDVGHGAGPGQSFSRLALHCLAAGAIAALFARLVMATSSLLGGWTSARILLPASFVAGGGLTALFLF